MATQDTPITPVSVVQQPDSPIVSPTIPSFSRDTRGIMAAEAAYIQHYLDGGNIIDSYDFYLNQVEVDRDLENLARQKAEADSEAITEEFVNNPYGTTGNIEDTTNAVRSALTTVQQRAADPDRQFVESLAGVEAEEQVLSDEAAKTKMFKVVSDLEEALGGWDYTMDFLKGAIPGRSTVAGFRLTGDIFGQDEEIAAAIQAFQSKPLQEQASMINGLAAELREKVGDVAALELLNNFVSPFGAEEVENFGDLETALDLIDLTGIGALAGQLIIGAKQGYNIVKTSARAGNTQGAADINTAALLDDTLREGTGMTELTPVGNALPFDTPIIDSGHQGGLSSATLDNLREFSEEADKTASDIIEGVTFLKEGIISTARRAQLEEEAISRFKAEQAENIEFVSRDGNTTTFSYQIRNEDGDIVDQTETLKFTLNDAGMWEQDTANIVAQGIASPTVFARGTLREDVSAAERLDFLKGRISNQLQRLTLEALRPVGLFPTKKTKESLARVDNALVQGDEWKNVDGTRGKVFSVDELRTQFNLQENEISAYYRIRRLYDNIWRIANAEKRNEMIALNYRYANFSRNGESVAGKTYDNAQTANGALRSQQIDFIYDANLDEVIDVKNNGEGLLKTAYAEDKVLVRMDDGHDIGENRGSFTYALVNAEDVTDLPQVVLPRKEGYVPRIYEDAVHFVKRSRPSTINGNKSHTTTQTLRFFDSKKDAETFRRQMIDKAKEEEGLSEADALEQFQVLGDRELEKLSGLSDAAGHGVGGLYTGARAQDDILFGLNGEKANRVNSYEALTRNIGNISKHAAINQWRLGIEQRWINTANRIFKGKGIKQPVEKFQRLSTEGEAVDEVRFLNRMYDQIRDWQNFPTPDEQFFQTAMRSLYDWSKKKDHKRTAKLIGNFRDGNPIAAARATAFHALLGWFNPSQMWVQAQGASIALSLGLGKYSSRALANTAALTAVGEGVMDAGRIRNAIKAAGLKASGVSEQDFKRLHNLWIKTGYQDSVLQTADHAAAAKGYGMTMGAIKKAADAGLLFYRNGELFTRRFSFNIAVERWLEKNAGKTIADISDGALKNIMDDANNMMLNMSRANRANWQKGVWSLPTQFLQVTTKFIETAGGFNRNFERGEIGRILTGQIMLYGTAGIPLAGLGTMILSDVFGLSQTDIEDNPGLVKTFNDGFWGAVGHWMLGVDIEMSSRGSLLRGMGDLLDNWFVQESTFTEKFLGPFGAVGQRWLDNFTRALRPITISPGQAIDWTTPWDLVASPVIRSISTWSNAEKGAYMALLDQSYSRSGYVQDARDFSLMEEIAQAIGFQQTSSATIADLRARERHLKQVETKIFESILLNMNEFALRHPNGGATDEEIDEAFRNNELLYGALDFDQQQRVSERIQDALTGSTALQTAVGRYLERMKNNTAEDLSAWHSFFIGNGVIRLGIGEEEEE